jgi:A/G-specific adenine glycosylase
MSLSSFKKTVWNYHRDHRRDLPWRTRSGKNKIDPYYVFVSEIMLQQTQAPRVVAKFLAFIEKFPTVESLARAKLHDVLSVWQGLGYNRRAKYIRDTALEVVTEHNGVFPKDPLILESFAGIGPYTARAIASFAYNSGYPFIETNIRTVFIHHFFKDSSNKVSDTELMPYIVKTLDVTNPREWYYALMDYGSYLKKEGKGSNSKSKHYIKQSKFKGSDREIRGQILKQLILKKKLSLVELKKVIKTEPARIVEQVDSLLIEGLIVKKGNTYCIS